MSEHTKGELTVDHGGLWAGPDGMLCVADCIDGDFDANAARLALCWNEHDALAEKALLVDELVAALEAIAMHDDKDHPCDGITRADCFEHMQETAKAVLAKTTAVR